MDHNNDDDNENELNANICALKTIMCYSQISNNISDYNDKIYNSTECIHTTCDYLAYSVKFIFAALTNQRIEPLIQQWFRTGYITYENDKFIYDCKYHYLKDDFSCEFILKSDLYIYITTKFENYITKLSKEFYNSQICANYEKLPNLQSNQQIYKCIKPLFTMKCKTDEETYIISRLINYNYKFDNFEKSNIHFLSIEYTHPDMDEVRIPLELDADIYVKGNEILSVGMVKHLLEHQLDSYIFDSKYSVFLMDNNIDLYELKIDEYILLDKDKIYIMNYG
uniref:Uncharacterized protein n=1 Tax=viral metagenome TaxID=1070528 RepID=A0A6C0I0M8_9ZZZZ